ncbi:hypothetical protein H7J87_08410 [Mycolicibacterium wolinskyi]|uniref:Uncharacterized protein n=1 Tax=Mycolicibacterium wolinskyi TaxID=59750 RepID=A0A1X2FH08_9MYCO|nr:MULTISPECIES: hypothetical protein [Mycolicibacterium]MCV7285349.1 hypothetical protein [Mycolicibacterium wolinskyi]MCV7295148.1 hypothetical protein [Mycolicibacterium goodii]ORX17716.1 hypothetical protein AWC31_14830 [Mycolicibacterium wolinskyi]
MTDERCRPIAGREINDKTVRSTIAIDSDRALRLVLASLKGDEDSRSRILDSEAGDCPSCLRGIAVSMAGMFASSIEMENDEESDDGLVGTDKAIRRIEWMISRGIEKRLTDQ